MTPKEKAKEILDKVEQHSLYWDFYNDEPLEEDHTKQLAFIMVNEIITQWEYIDTHLADLGGQLNPNLRYWLEVKQEIEKL